LLYTLPADRPAGGGLTSPVNGTIVLWRLRVGGSTTPTSLKVVKRLPGGLFTGAGTSATVTPSLNSMSTFPTSLPIQIGESVGITCCESVAEYFIGSGGSRLLFSDGLADGGPGRAGSGTSPKEIALNADIEPTSSIGGLNVVSKKHGKLRVSVDVPNPGTLSATGKLLKRASAAVAAPGQVSITLKPTKKALSRLADKRKLKAKLQLVFTPTGGSVTTTAVKAKLKG
jgi:hypothetical protein